jgi:ATP-dependent Clp protease ATP-binding subunit ClpC
MFEKFTEGAIKVIMLSQEEARRMGHNFVGTEQLLLGIVGQRGGLGAKALRPFNVNLRKTRKEVEMYIGRGTGYVSSEIPFTPRAKRVLELAVQEGKDLNQNYVGTEHILLALIAEKDGIAFRTLRKMRVDLFELRRKVLKLIGDNQEEILRPLTASEKLIIERERRPTRSPTLEEYGTNLSKAASDRKLDPILGRDEEVSNVVKVLARRSKNNPVLVGEPGVGKTAVAEGLAQLIVSQDVPKFLEGGIVMNLDLGTVLAGTKYRGEFEERLRRIVEETQADPSVILVIDEIHTIIGAGAAEGAVDAANILKPALARGKFKCIGATTIAEYRKYIERDAALERRFQPVEVPEPSIGVTIEILRGLRPRFESHHNLHYTDKSIQKAAILSSKFIQDRYLPDKAIDVLDEAGSAVRLTNRAIPYSVRWLIDELKIILVEKDKCIKQQEYMCAHELVEYESQIRLQLRVTKQGLKINEKMGFTRIDMEIVTEDDVAKVISRWTGIPMDKVSDKESKKLLNMEDTLTERIIGQHRAISSVSRAVRRARVGLRNPNRPIASFIFAGPTGVGKTELTKALANYLFGNDNAMIRLDMSEYMEKHTVSKLIGSPPGYVGYNDGGQLTEAVRNKPYSVVLCDEIEKAHVDIFNIMLQVLDDGRLSDARGKLIDFKSTLIIMTSNIGTGIIEKETLRNSNYSSYFEAAPKTLAMGIDMSKLPSEIRKRKEAKKKGKNIARIKTPEEIENNKRKDEVLNVVSGLVIEELQKYFRPEFLNRIDEIIVFCHLTEYDISKIANILMKQLVDRMKEKGYKLMIHKLVKDKIIREGYDPVYGARPLRRAIMRILEDTLAQACLSKPLFQGTTIYVEYPYSNDPLCDSPDGRELSVTINYSNIKDKTLLDTYQVEVNYKNDYVSHVEFEEEQEADAKQKEKTEIERKKEALNELLSRS